jgi:hypothetical protein
MTASLLQRIDMAGFITMICDTMQRDGKIELDCGHFAVYGNSDQEIVLLEEDSPQHFTAL